MAQGLLDDTAVLACRIAVAAIALASLEAASRHSQLSGPMRTEDPVEPGTGGTLVVVAPADLCQPDLELMLARTLPYGGGRRYVFLTPVKPPECRWTIGDVPQGEYQAVLRKARGDQRVVAMSRIDVQPGSSWTTTVASMRATVEGLVTVQRIPVVGAYVEVKQDDGAGWSWDARTDREGYYRLAVQADADLCVRVVIPNALNGISPQCRGFGPGVNRRDFDLPPGRIDVILVPHDGPIYPTQIMVVHSGPGFGGGSSVAVTGRIERAFVALEYGKHRIRATTFQYDQEFDAVDVVLTPDEPVKRISLSVPYSR
jgi:hypothetical protein